jgi:tetratricopeptide (TPR) repeat protein
MENIKYDVFLSRKSEDSHMAKEIYDFLTNKGLMVFDSDQELNKIKESEYTRVIDAVLENCKNLIVIGSKPEFFREYWIQREWRIFEKLRETRKDKGNILVMISNNLLIKELPPALQIMEIAELTDSNLEKVYPYLFGEKLAFENKYETGNNNYIESLKRVIKPYCKIIDYEFVGRKKEIDILESYFRKQNEDSKTSVVFLEAEAGLGKSTLIRRFLEDKEVPVFRVECLEENSDTGKIPLIDLIIQILNFRISQDLEKGGLIVNSFFNKHPIWFRLVGQRIGFKTNDLELVDSQNVTFLQLTDFLRSTFIDTNVIVIFEDFHQADQSTLDIIRKLFALEESINAFFILTARPSHENFRTSEEIDFFNNFRKDIRQNKRTKILDLTGDLNSKEYLDLKYRPNLFPIEFLEKLNKLSDGNPLFITKSIENWEHENLITKNNNGVWELYDFKNINIPITLSEVIKERVNQIKRNDSDKKLIKILNQAAVSGVEFCAQIVQELIDRNMSEDEFIDNYLVEKLKEEFKFIEYSVYKGNDYYKFIHQFLREFIYENLGGEAAKFHSRLATYFIEKHGETDLYAGLIFFHLVRGNESEHAIPFGLKAALKEEKDGNFLESEKLGMSIVEIIKSTTLKSFKQETLETCLLLGRSRYAVGKMDQAYDSFKSAIEMEEFKLLDEEARDHNIILFAEVCDEEGKFKEGIEIISKIISQKEDKFSLGTIGVQFMNQLLKFRIYDFENYLEIALELRSQIDIFSPEMFQMRIKSRLVNGIGLYYNIVNNDHHKAITYFTEAANIAKSNHDYRTQMTCLANWAESLYYLAEFELSLKIIAEVKNISQQNLSHDNFGWASVIECMNFHSLNRFEEAKRSIDLAIERLTYANCNLILPYAYSRKAHLLFSMGQNEKSWEALKIARSYENLSEWVTEDIESVEKQLGT